MATQPQPAPQPVAGLITDGQALIDALRSRDWKAMLHATRMILDEIDEAVQRGGFPQLAPQPQAAPAAVAVGQKDGNALAAELEQALQQDRQAAPPAGAQAAGIFGGGRFIGLLLTNLPAIIDLINRLRGGGTP